MGFLAENHKCPGGVWARVGKALLTVLLGGLIGTVVVYAVEEGPASALVLAAAALGAVLAMAIRQAVGGGRL
jgi:hypothetical protein